MSRLSNKLSAKQIPSLATGRHSDGEGLYVYVQKTGRRSWLFRYTKNGKTHEKGLGKAYGNNAVSLAAAREKANQCRELIAQGQCPISVAKALNQPAQAPTTFKDCAVEFMRLHLPSLKNEKHQKQWISTLETYVYPEIGDRPVADIKANDVFDVLKGIWNTKRETAERIRGRVENILNFAGCRGDRNLAVPNPARLKGNLEFMLPKGTPTEQKHFAAMPFADVPAFMTRLRAKQATSALALEFAILNASRTGEVIGARWAEIDLANELWIIPSGRMKAKKEHIVPLSKAAVDVLKQVHPLGGEFVFQTKSGKPLSNMAMLAMLKGMHEEYTVHGFRSSFRDWASEITDHSWQVCEMALAHTISNEAEAAYRRGNLLDKRRNLMNDWGNYLK